MFGALSSDNIFDDRGDLSSLNWFEEELFVLNKNRPDVHIVTFNFKAMVMSKSILMYILNW